jgi:ferredoxin
MTIFKVTLIDEEQQKETILEVATNEIILDTVLRQGFSEKDLTYIDEKGVAIKFATENEIGCIWSCRAGACTSCAVKVIEGKVTPVKESFFLDKSQLKQGYTLLCRISPKSDCKILLKKEDDLY